MTHPSPDKDDAKTLEKTSRQPEDPVAIPPTLGEPLEFMRLLWGLNHALEVTSARMSTDIGVTASQRMLIRVTGRFPKILAGQLAELLCVDAGTISTALARLEGRGLVKRERPQNDRRKVTVELTAAGRELDVPASNTVESAVLKLLDKLPAEQIDAARAVLSTLAQIMIEQARS